MVTRASAKAKGAKFNKDVAETLRFHGWPYADKRSLSGRYDRGDIGGVDNVATEVKAEASYAGKLAGWLTEADVEAKNAGVSIPIVWHKRKGKTNPEECYVTMWGSTWLMILKALRDGKTLQDI